MDHLPLARVTDLIALQDGKRLVFYANGVTSGFGGYFEITHSKTLIYPPVFYVHEVPGNSGINPDASPTLPTAAAIGFDNVSYREVQVVTADGTLFRKPIPVTTFRGDVNAPLHALDGSASASAGTGENEPRLDDWHALFDHMPPGPRKLTVSCGLLLMPSGGYKVALKKAADQGRNPFIRYVDLVESPPSGIATWLMTPTPVTPYVETPDMELKYVVVNFPTKEGQPPKRKVLPVESVS